MPAAKSGVHADHPPGIKGKLILLLYKIKKVFVNNSTFFEFPRFFNPNKQNPKKCKIVIHKMQKTQNKTSKLRNLLV